MFFSVLFLSACTTNPQPAEVSNRPTITMRTVPYAEQAQAAPSKSWLDEYELAQEIGEEDVRSFLESEAVKNGNSVLCENGNPKNCEVTVESIARHYHETGGMHCEQRGEYFYGCHDAIRHDGKWYHVLYAKRDSPTWGYYGTDAHE